MIQITINGINYVSNSFNRKAASSYIQFEEDDLTNEDLTCIEFQAKKGVYEFYYVGGGIIIKVENHRIQKLSLGANLERGRIWN